jgi:signal transduction histidine kinase
MHRPVSPSRSRTLVASPIRRLLRRARLLGLRATRALTLSQRFLIAAVLVVAVAMGALGNWIGVYLQQGITNGVATTAAASIDSLVAHQIGDVTPGRRPTPDERARLDTAFALGNDSNSTRLLQIRVRTLDGAIFYEATSGFTDRSAEQENDIAAAMRGEVAARIVDVTVAPVGPIPGFPLTVLEIDTPLRRDGTAEVFAVAELYYSARSVIELRDKAQRDVWVLVGLFGLGVVAALYLLVNRASRTIALQRDRLASNLAASRRLSDENLALRDASEELRLNANFSNESLLAQVGSDIHDGPIQLLTLIILKLTKALKPKKTGASIESELATTIQVATDTMEELRNISSGLVLPELADLALEQTLALAISRHEDLTATVVTRSFDALPPANVAAKICAYRVIQEALSNAFRHGRGIDQRVTATASGDVLRLEISNAARRRPAGNVADDRLGLRGMRFRVESLGGELVVDLGNKATARVVATIPLGVAADQA